MSKHDNDEQEQTAVAGMAEEDKSELKGKEYMRQLRKLQTELCLLQDWVKHTGERVIVVFEGRDAAGKGGVIRAVTERVSPRVFRLVALPAPTDREKTQMYMQRYLAHFPAAGEIVMFDRSWYNRAGVVCHGILHQKAAQALPGKLSCLRALHRRERHQADQILARGQQRRTETEV